jgi:uncharacterized secreted protein with C-terminal beta-propeller domain
MSKKALAIFILILLTATVLSLTVYFWSRLLVSSQPSTPPKTPSDPPAANQAEILKFDSEEEFKEYLALSEKTSPYLSGISVSSLQTFSDVSTRDVVNFSAPETGSASKTDTPERVSGTNVQVTGIDEPDILKTDGKEIYFSSTAYSNYRLSARTERSSIAPPVKESEIKLLKAFPPPSLKKDAAIEKSGNLLLIKNTLVVFASGERKIYGYDVSDPTAPKESWVIDLSLTDQDNDGKSSQSQITSARLYQDKIYLITQTDIDYSNPCPIRPMVVEGSSLTVPCEDIYHPKTNILVDLTYTASIVDPQTGQVEKRVSFVGSSSSSVVYMSEDALYLTYFYPGDYIKLIHSFYLQNKDLISTTALEKMERLQTYDLSSYTKLVELQTIYDQYKLSLSRDEKLRVENETQDRLEDYLKTHQRSLENTGIVKVGLDGFQVEATGIIPGKILNQYSLDQYQDHLRIATTVGESWWGRGARESVNDVYVLNQGLQVVGSILDLGLNERIYSARFVKDKGYLVTFRQIDPFYVLDLADPANPQKVGELKIPGYSSYLHPINKDKILGIGKEGAKVKISLFDVSSPDNPLEADKYTLDESWSEILNTQYAFLLDSKHQVFFLPGSKGGYIFSYQGDDLKLVKAVSDITPRRALFINDYLYLIADTKLVVLNEKDWQKVSQLEF